MGPKMPDLGIFGLEFQKNCYHIWNPHPQICQIAKACEKKWKRLNLGPKMPYLGIFGKEIQESIAIFGMSTLDFVKLRNFVKKMKMLKFGTKNAWFGYFWARNSKKTIVVFEISTLKFVRLRNFVKKWKCLNVGPKMPYLGISGQEF